MNLPFNKPHLSGMEAKYISQAVANGHISGNGQFTKKCQSFFEERWGFKKCLLTTSCTDALEMCALLLDIQPGDEVIMPSFTFVSTALAFVRQGAKIVFVDSRTDHPGMDEDLIEELVTPKTKAIIAVHYAGVACDMDKIMTVAEKYHLWVVEDAAQAVDSYYNDKPLGGIGHLGCFSFHETKNIQCGEGGMLVINDERFSRRAEIIWEKGTNRAEFFRGETNKYGWVDIGSSFLPSDIIAAFLFAQLEELEDIQKRRCSIWHSYFSGLENWSAENGAQLPFLPEYATNNAHMFYMVCKNLEQRTALIKKMKENDILAVFHYLSLHKSPFYQSKHDGRELPESDRYSDCLVRLPMFYDLEEKNIRQITELINGNTKS
ncbi:MAG: dTDP-4-amino-4,6-dideoxygalactose transaminase [Desulfobacterales bacterium]|nr:dTDP-4-amino-4,6-dideoxygalactose transaminase [Desulfobacterales bacterium]